MTRALGFALLFLLVLGGCGYHLAGRGTALPADLRTLSVVMFKNRTTQPFLENYVTNDVLERFAREGLFELTENSARADAVLSGAITGYSSVPIAYDKNDSIAEYRSTITVNATLRRRSNGRVFWKGNISWSEEYPANLDKTIQYDNEIEAIKIISRRLAEEIYYRVTDNF
jgi:outer membrane lipopolysaccharide assembly protein LptE/RlpB